MRIKNSEIISRSTKFLGRSLILVAATNLLVTVGWIDTENTAFFGIHFTDGKLAEVTFFASLFMLLSYLIAWTGDYLSSSAWNIEGLETAFMYFGGDGKSKIDKLLYRSESLLGEFDKNAEKVIQAEVVTKETFDGAVKNMHDNLEALKRDNRELTNSVRQFNWFRAFYVWVWYMIIPVSFALYSICIVQNG